MLTKKDVHDEIELAVVHISEVIGKALESTATKADLKSLATKGDLKQVWIRLDKVEEKLELVEGSLEGVKSELTYVKSELRNLQGDTPTVKEFEGFIKRVTLLENAVFPS